jgi:hypothetical protein
MKTAPKNRKEHRVKYQWKLRRSLVGVTLGVTLVAGCAARQPESPPGLATAEQQTASAASRAEQAAQRAEAAASKAEVAAGRTEQAAQRVEAATLKLEGQFSKRLRK